MESMYRHQLEEGGVDLPLLLVDVMTDFLSFDNLQKMEPSNNLCYRPLTMKRHKMREGISPLTTWSPHQSWSARWHNKNWLQSKMREGILLLNKPSLKVSNSMLKPNQHWINLTGKSIRHSSQMPTANWWWGNTLLDTYWCWKHVQASVTGGRGRLASSPLGRRNGRFHSLQKGEPSKNLSYYPLTVKRAKVREDTPSLTTWSLLQPWSARCHNKNWSQSKMREGISLLNKPSLKGSNSVGKLIKPSQSQFDWKEYQTFISDAHCYLMIREYSFGVESMSVGIS